MLSTLRTRVRAIMVIVAVTFILGFLLGELWRLIGSKSGGKRGQQTYSNVGVVGKHTITFDEYRNATTYITDKYKQDNMLRDLSNEDYAAIEQQTWRYLVTELTWAKVFKAGNIHVTQEELMEIAQSNPPEQLRNDPSLMKDGKFDQEKYMQLMNAPENRQFFTKYFRDLADMLPKEKFRLDAASAYRVTNGEIQDGVAAANTHWKVTSLFFGPKLVTGQPEPTDAEAKAYYDAHKDDYKTKETRQIRYVVFPVQITAQDSQVALDNVTRAYAQLQGGETFNITMLDFSDMEPETSGAFVPKSRLDPKTDTVVAKLKPGSYSPPFLTTYGWQIVALDSARKDSIALRRILVRVKSSGEMQATMRDSAGAFADKAATTDLDTLAARYGLPAMKYRPMVGGELNAAGLNADGINQFVDWAKTAKAGATFAKALRVPQGYMVLGLGEIQHAGVQPFDKVKAAASWKVRQEKGKAIFVAKANDAIGQIRSGKTLEQYAQENPGVELVTEDYAGVTDASRRKGPEFGGTVEALAAGDKYGPLNTDWGSFILRCDERTEATPPVVTPDAWVQQRREQLGQALLQSFLKEDNVKDYREGSNF